MVKDRERFALDVGVLQKLGITGVMSIAAEMRNVVAQFCACAAERPQLVFVEAQRQRLEDLEKPLLERRLVRMFKAMFQPSLVVRIIDLVENPFHFRHERSRSRAAAPLAVKGFETPDQVDEAVLDIHGQTAPQTEIEVDPGPNSSRIAFQRDQIASNLSRSSGNTVMVL